MTTAACFTADATCSPLHGGLRLSVNHRAPCSHKKALSFHTFCLARPWRCLAAAREQCGGRGLRHYALGCRGSAGPPKGGAVVRTATTAEQPITRLPPAPIRRPQSRLPVAGSPCAAVPLVTPAEPRAFQGRRPAAPAILLHCGTRRPFLQQLSQCTRALSARAANAPPP